MSIRKFERLVANSPFKFETLETVPIRPLRRPHCGLTREFFTSVVRSTLIHRFLTLGSTNRQVLMAGTSTTGEMLNLRLRISIPLTHEPLQECPEDCCC
jgi:hypothetical protein